MFLMQVSDSGVYVCDARNELGGERVETNLIVIAPLTATIHPPLVTVDESESVQLRCVASGHPIKVQKATSIILSVMLVLGYI